MAIALSSLASGCLVSLILRGYCGEVLEATLLRGTGGEAVILRGGWWGVFTNPYRLFYERVGGEFLLSVLPIFWLTIEEDAPVIPPALWEDDDVGSALISLLFGGGDGVILSTLKI